MTSLIDVTVCQTVSILRTLYWMPNMTSENIYTLSGCKVEVSRVHICSMVKLLSENNHKYHSNRVSLDHIQSVSDSAVFLRGRD